MGQKKTESARGVIAGLTSPGRTKCPKPQVAGAWAPIRMAPAASMTTQWGKFPACAPKNFGLAGTVRMSAPPEYHYTERGIAPLAFQVRRLNLSLPAYADELRLQGAWILE